ncbi:UbiA family prenyltransferase [Siccirubricoccus sp. KC 17139]|uniref:UbiA family prenyltransferase n=1 Tax=Siccirubricoccus soli TaxID=2899147 RepID=A0ABT1D0R4_9PROT|nr:UbiA family prenyltransferase [Siccirubricoccus soli]MCO6415498.1 UbiA family prenyltransferase [Siccirubricoccus soli]MCP2681630.1 UbiA family prenyltransferase [Siccirubricoccus soli]
MMDQQLSTRRARGGAAQPDLAGPLPLAVDLDGTLLATDTLHEGLVAALLRQPWALPGILAVLPRGRAAFKREVSRIAPCQAGSLPLRWGFLEWLRSQRAAGRELHLVTAADQSVADAVAQQLGLFASATGSDGGRNLAGIHKAEFLRKRFPGGFAYAGDSRHDVPVFAAAQEVVLVAAPADVVAAARHLHPEPLAEFPRETAGPGTWLRAMRLHQWSKNALLLVPLLLAHRFTDLDAVLACLAGMLALGLIASGTYLLNDLADLASDRAHRQKRARPIAAGRIRPLHALAGAVLLLLLGLGGAALLGLSVLLGGLAYIAVSLAYSARLKRVPLLDTLIIAGLFTLRLALGVELAAVPYSPWLMGFAGFFFLSLALAKRHGELVEARDGPPGTLTRRGWEPGDWPLTLAFGAASAMAALQIMLLYVADEVQPSLLYARPGLLYVAPPLLAVWLARIWLLAHRKELREDPVVFALRDPWSWLLGAAIAGALLLAL